MYGVQEHSLASSPTLFLLCLTIRSQTLLISLNTHVIALLPFLAAFVSPSLASEGTPKVLVPGLDVSYHGTRLGSVEHFQGIKYAHDTSGKKRFAPPEAFVPSPGSVFQATSPGLACPQMREAIPPAMDETKDISEDCLNLRIARPVGLDADSKAPVVVWVHGGGVVKGTAYDSHFVPDKLVELSAADGKPVVYASLNYRFTIFGFPSLPVLKEQKSMNLGLRDQRLALEWIRDNIAAFGGDPSRVTVYGLSSGGTLSSLQLMAYGGETSPFQRLWAMSGPPGTNLNMSTDGGLLHTQAVARSLGCDDSGDAATLQCLRDVPMQKLLDKATDFAKGNHPPHGIFTFLPTVDGDFFPDRPTELVKSGRFAKGINLIFGWTQDDGAMNALPAQAVQTEPDIKAPVRKYARLLTDSQFDKLFSLYPEADFEPDVQNYNLRRRESDPEVSVHFFRASRILRDLLFTCSSLKLGFEMTRQTRRHLDPSFDGVRLYDLNQTVYGPMLGAIGLPFVGTCHGSEQVYIFNGVFPEGSLTEEHSEFASMLSRNLIHFAYMGDPSASVQWPPSFESASGDDDADVLPSRYRVQVIGGLHGTGPVQLSKSKEGVGYFPGAEHLESLQKVLPDALGFAGMKTKEAAERQRLLQAERLHERCTYVNELSESLGI